MSRVIAKGDPYTVDMVSFNAITGKVSSMRSFQVTPRGGLVGAVLGPEWEDATPQCWKDWNDEAGRVVPPALADKWDTLLYGSSYRKREEERLRREERRAHRHWERTLRYHPCEGPRRRRRK